MDSYAGTIWTGMLYGFFLIQLALAFKGNTNMDENWLQFGLNIASAIIAMIVLMIQQTYSMKKDAKNFDDVKERIRDTKTDVKEKVDANKNTLEKEHDQILQGQKELSKDLSQKLASIREDQIRVQDQQKFMKEQLPTAFELQKDIQNILNALMEKETLLHKTHEELSQAQERILRLEKELKAEKEERRELADELHEIKCEVKMPKGFRPDRKDSYDIVDH